MPNPYPPQPDAWPASAPPHLDRGISLDPASYHGSHPQHVPDAVLHWAALVEAGLIGRTPPTNPAIAANRARTEALVLGRRRVGV